MSDPAHSPDTLDGYCLPEEVIHALACGGLEEAQRSKALAHLDDCELCQALLADEVRDLPQSASADDPGLPTLIQIDALVAGRYRIEHFVARGGMGEVYEAWDELLAERVALKTINPLVASADQARASARFRQEVQLSRRVADPHVCRIYEFGQHLVRGFGALSYLTMELLEGETLGARLRRGPRLSMAEVLELGRQMLRGLGAAHAVGVLHRDFKSDNVMLRSGPSSGAGLHAVIMDFGLARLLGDQVHRFTERYELVGSAAYMAPEQLEDGAALSEATDIYAFGVVLFEMLTGRLPFEGSSPVAVALRRLSHPAPPPSLHVPDLGGAWDALVARCLQRDPSRRFASTGELGAALEAVAHEPPRSQRRRPNRQQLAMAVVAGVALLGGVSHFSGRGRAEAERTLDAVALSLDPQVAALPAGAAPAAVEAPAAPAPAPAAAPPSEPSQLEPVQVAAVDPAAINPAAINPAAINPAAINPAAINPAPVEPALGGPTPTQPALAAGGAPTPAQPTTPAPQRASPKPHGRGVTPAAATPGVAPATGTSGAVASATPAPQAEAPPPPPAPDDVRDLFFLEAPSAQNSER